MQISQAIFKELYVQVCVVTVMGVAMVMMISLTVTACNGQKDGVHDTVIISHQSYGGYINISGQRWLENTKVCFAHNA